MMTYGELQGLVYTGDPLAERAHPERVVLDPELGLILRGCCDDSGYSDDLRIKIEGDLLMLYYRDPEDADEEMWGREWIGPVPCATYDDVVGFAYSL